MKTNLYLFLLVGLMCISCNQEAIAPYQACQDVFPSSPTHAKAAEFQSALEEYVSKGVPGVVAAIYTPNEGLWVGAAGKAVIETAEPMNPCNLFFSASLAKTYHVVAALALAEDGLLELDKPIDQYLSESHAQKIPNSSRITVQQLMNHTSGIPDFIENIDHVTDYLHNLNRTYTQDDYLDYIQQKSPLFEPGTDVSYSNTNTTVLALIMDQVYGNHAKALTDKIIQPLGLSRTFYKNEAAYPSPTGLSNCYIDLYGNGKLQNSTAWESNFSQMNIGHDGMIVHPYDNYLFLKALFEGNILSPAMVDSMQDAAMMYSESEFFAEGLGLEITFLKDDFGRRIGHNGGSLGGAHEMRYYPKQGVYLCISANFAGFIDSPIEGNFYPTTAQPGNVRSMYDELERIALGV
ncbi:MAG: serine hydrolase domain-containing protein [Bacteroidota bacterium]